MEEKAKSFPPVTLMKGTDLAVNLLSFLWPGKGNLSCRQISSDFSEIQDIKYNELWKMPCIWTHLNLAIGNLHTVTYCHRREAGADSDTLSLASYKEFLGYCYRCSFHRGSETENKVRTVTSAPLAEPEILQFSTDYMLGIKMDFKYKSPAV